MYAIILSQFEFSSLTGWTGYSYQDKMTPKLFLISLIMIFLVRVSQAKRKDFFKLLHQASEDQKIQFAKSSFELYDANKNGFLTSDEFDNMDFGILPIKSLTISLYSLPYIREMMMEALIQFEQEHKDGIEPNKIGITFEDYKDTLKRQLEQIYGKSKRTILEMAELNLVSEDLKIRFFKASFKLYDSNKDGFVTSHEFHNVYFGTLPYNSLIRETMTEALIQFEQEHENGIEPNKIGITLEDYKDALKRKFEQIYGKKSE